MGQDYRQTFVAAASVENGATPDSYDMARGDLEPGLHDDPVPSVLAIYCCIILQENRREFDLRRMH